MSRLLRGRLLTTAFTALLLAIAVVGVSACASASQASQQASQEQTTINSASTNWDAVGQAIGKEGKLMKGDVYRVDLPRSDLKVAS